MLSLSSLLSFAPGLRAQAPRLQAGADVPARLASRVATAVARAWGVDTAGLVLSWGTGTASDIPDSSAFRVMGRGDDGWFVVSFEPPGRPARAIRLRAGMSTLTAVATRVLRPGTRLAATDIRMDTTLVWGPPTESETPAEGWLVKRVVSAGDPLDGFRVEPPPVVTAGQPVRVLWQRGNVTVALEGTALNDAGIGGRVRITTEQRPGVVTGTVTAPGQARMP